MNMQKSLLEHILGILSLAALGLLMVCTSVLMFAQDPLPSIIKMILTLSEGSIFYGLWSTPPYEIYLKIYAFNITNPEEFLSGKEKMNVTQLGPYVYREILTNRNATFNDTDGTVSYSPYREIIYDEEKSVGNPKLDSMMTTNLPFVGLQSYMNDDSYIKNFGFATVARSLGAEPIINKTVEEYLWGYSDSLINYAHTLLPSWIDFDTFGIVARLLSRDNTNRVTIVNDPAKYHSSTDHFLTEEEKMAQYHVAKWNDLPGLKDWGYEKLSPEEVKKCHLVEGTFDGTIFPRNMPANISINLFRKAFCRPVRLEFVEDSVSKEGFRQYEYKLSDNMFDASKENDCFCHKNNCMKGFQNVGPCYYGIPISLSQPHFLNANKDMLTTVNGLNPDVNLHGSSCTIQPDIGVPLGGSMKIQINLDVGQTKGNYKTKVFNGLQVPLFWIEITVDELPTLVVIILQLVCNVLPILLEIVKYLLGIVGLALISGLALYTLLKTKVRIPGGISINGSEYTAIPMISIPVEILDKCEKKFSLKR